ncbi:MULTISPECIES: conjugal transfer protein TraD [unclassified Mesorhizobium]|uniref:conjugal transfer protein TraD n=1 Tax=unclassified Mesorhizobium TaxID=325217 RepID=UPI0011269083|nr:MULTISPECIES: conjugal transfer protein TraD [unclassified Mesorhizobium]MCA0060430.1 conjugal transfer protein TraD [Mesorhizobium sp. B261B1A]TPI44942.1 conjugal transfer protein TraD [Mesorhizobium sp. B3-1-1]TPJ56855.1 conjugal transfer protein TraD [Mesorhizobium sp. B2-6-7]TPJ75486.1 conjugal transfer protein TraD [Mesorhizobium sp. B2-6-3]TPJ90203.1 conjugal transfer protein TraD [Mesorhizobium sp. B2-5-10]
MRVWQVERRKRTRHLIELGGLVVKAGIVELTNDNRATILGALLWMADKLKSEDAERARNLWAEKGKEAFMAERNEELRDSKRSDVCRERRAVRRPQIS